MGVRANSDAVFSIASSTSGGTLPIPQMLDFFTGRFEGYVATGEGLVFQIAAPADASRLKFSGTHSGAIEFRLEQGTWPTLSGGTHWAGGVDAPNLLFNQTLSASTWPWLPGGTYFLRLINHGSSPEPVLLQFAGSIAFTEDENNNGLYDWWERLHLSGAWWWYEADWDPDLDGRPNLVEAVFATDPNHPDGTALATPVIASTPRVLGIRFSLADPIPAGATLVVEGTGDLQAGTWQALATKVANGAWTGTATVEQTPPANGKVTVIVRDTAHAGATKRFLRLRVFR